MMNTLRSIALLAVLVVLGGFMTRVALGQDAIISSISNPSVVEGNSGTTTVTFDVTCDPCAPVNVIIFWQINDGTATTANNDYVDTSSSMSGELDDVGQASGVEVPSLICQKTIALTAAQGSHVTSKVTVVVPLLPSTTDGLLILLMCAPWPSATVVTNPPSTTSAAR